MGSGGPLIVAEPARHRLTPPVVVKVQCLLEPDQFLALMGSWADDVRHDRPGSYNWHFVDLAPSEDRYAAAAHCLASSKGGCIVGDLECLLTEQQWVPSDDLERGASRSAVHFVGDIHQPLHTVGESRVGSDIAVDVWRAGAKTGRGRLCSIMSRRSNFHHDTPVEWARETHRAVRHAWEPLPASHVVDDACILRTLDRPLRLARLRLARFLNDVQAPGAVCSSTIANNQ
jgi:hypothetical protein